MPTLFYSFVGYASWPIMRGLYRLETHGVEHLPTEGGFVLAANHTSNFDPWPLGYPLWPKRQLYFMAKVELFNPFLGPPLRAGGAFPVRRGEQDIEAMEAAVDLCRDGKIVAMFPEGTRRSKGLVKKFSHRPRTGAARIALTAGVPLVPAAIVGTDSLARLARLKVTYGQPVEVGDLAEMPARDAARLATERLMKDVYELFESVGGKL